MAENRVDVIGEVLVQPEISIEWKIHNFSVSEVRGKKLESPPFSLGDSTFCLTVYPSSCSSFERVGYELKKIDSKPSRKTLTFYLDTKGCITSESEPHTYTFTQISPSGGYIYYSDLQQLKNKTNAEGALTLTCRVLDEVSSDESSKQDPQQMKQLVELESLSLDFKNMLSSEIKCDVTVVVQGKEFRAHRAVLSARSPVFRAMYEHDTSENQTGVLPISDCDPNTFGEFLNFLYTGKLEEVSFCTAYNLYTTAEKYDVQQLKTFCATYLANNLSSENICDIVILADKFDDDMLRSSAQNFFNKNFLNIFQTSSWTNLLKNNYRLADKLLKSIPVPKKNS